MATDPQKISKHIASTIGNETKLWEKPSDGWAGEIEAAFLDSVLSVQANYGNSADTGVRLRIRYWREERGKLHGDHVALDDLSELARFDNEAQRLAAILKNRQTLSGKSRRRPLKSLAVAQAARLFTEHGIIHASQIENCAEQKRLWRSVDGLGPATWHYVLMLLGKPDVKADTMITRFVKNTVGRRSGNEEVRLLIVDAAKAYDVSATELDYAIWSWQRKQPRYG